MPTSPSSLENLVCILGLPGPHSLLSELPEHLAATIQSYAIGIVNKLFPGRAPLAMSGEGGFGASRTGTLHLFNISPQQMVQHYARQSSEMRDGHTAADTSFPYSPREGTQSPSL